MDEAHTLASQGAPAGTLVLAHSQTAGRGRSGGKWLAYENRSVLCTIIERPRSASAIDVLSLRVGLNAAQSLDTLAGYQVQLKWPNDLFLNGGKIAGVLIETRWRQERPEWVAIAMGINIGEPPAEVAHGAGLPATTSRLDVLAAIIPAMRAAAANEGPLNETELSSWSDRDLLAGRAARAPVAGTIRGILPTGELVIDTRNGPAALRSGSVTLEDS